jgi:hypothetical protein
MAFWNMTLCRLVDRYGVYQITRRHNLEDRNITRERQVNRSQIDIKRKACDIQSWKKTFISGHILHHH